MKTYARIDAGKVVELFETEGDISTMFHPSLQWVEITKVKPAVGVGFLYDGEFSPPAELVIDPKIATTQQIVLLEAKVTPRRMREALLSGNYEFIQSVDAEVAALRKSL